MKYYDFETDRMVEQIGDLTKRQWPSRQLLRWNDVSWKAPGHCACCDKPLKEWKGAYYGVFSDCNTLYDYEYSYFTNYCEDCAKNEALRTRKADYKTCPAEVSHTENIHDDGYLCERTVYEDGSVVESTADSIKDAQRWW